MWDILVLSRMVRKTQVFPEKIEQALEGDEGEREFLTENSKCKSSEVGTCLE